MPEKPINYPFFLLPFAFLLTLLWYGFGSPHCENDIAEAFPLEQVQAWKAYLGLPLFGKRSPGVEELMHRQMEYYAAARPSQVPQISPVFFKLRMEKQLKIPKLLSKCPETGARYDYEFFW